MERVVRILMIDDDEDDAIIVKALLSRVPGGHFDVELCTNAGGGIERLRSGEFDVCLLDEVLGGARGSELLATLETTSLSTPVLMLTGLADRSIDLDAMRAGAADYLVKQELRWDNLDRAIRYAIERARLIAELHQREARLRELATVDELTGLFNRRHFMDLLPGAISAARRHKHPLSLCVCDLDLFKEINDRYGHPMGDSVLRAFGRLLRDSVRTEDTPARFGGDEFVVLMPFTTGNNARIAASRLQQIYAQMRFVCSDGTVVRNTASCGVAELGEGMSGQELIAQADRALYMEKAARPRCATEGSHQNEGDSGAWGAS